MLLHIFVGSLLPYIEGLDSWLFEGTLDDPFEEVIMISNLFYIQKRRKFCLFSDQGHLRSNSTLLKIEIISCNSFQKGFPGATMVMIFLLMTFVVLSEWI
jgi:hypothetical protein